MITRILIVTGAALAVGCTSPQDRTPAGEVHTSSSLFAYVQKNGGQIWAENCSRCHIPRPATQYSAQQWDLITTHMRLRCNLNGEEQRAVYRFMSGQ
jgi:hypothetical protein